jgi:predicted nucleic acid-binding protein
MNRRLILVDTSVWSLALRRKNPSKEAKLLDDLLQDLQVAMIGPIRQELLTGIRETAVYNKLKRSLAALEDWPILTEDYETAARFANLCRRHGVIGSHTDFIICAVAARNNMSIWTTDKDFINYQPYLPIELWKPSLLTGQTR